MEKNLRDLESRTSVFFIQKQKEQIKIAAIKTGWLI